MIHYLQAAICYKILQNGARKLHLLHLLQSQAVIQLAAVFDLLQLGLHRQQRAVLVLCQNRTSSAGLSEFSDRWVVRDQNQHLLADNFKQLVAECIARYLVECLNITSFICCQRRLELAPGCIAIVEYSPKMIAESLDFSAASRA